MRRRAVLLMALTFATTGLVAVVADVAEAGGGGVCTKPVKTARGTVVQMKRLCFSPTVLKVGVGEKVTWVNRDEMSHVVAGTNSIWGSGDLSKDQMVTYRFRRAGLYPYSCYYHPGMNGVVVVGKYKGAGAASTSPTGGEVEWLPEPAEAPVEELPSPAPRLVTRFVTERSSGAWQVGTFAGFGLFLLAAAGLVRERRSRRASSGSPRA